MAYTYEDFLGALEETERPPAVLIAEAISTRHPAYQPVIVKLQSKAGIEWSVSFRKNPKTGKPLCTCYAQNGTLQVRFMLFSSMAHALLLRQHEFSRAIQYQMLENILCCAHAGCRAYGGNVVCQWQQRFFVGGHMVKACPNPWVTFSGLTASDLDDLNRLLDLQGDHLVQNAKEVKGNGYAVENEERCGAIAFVDSEAFALDRGETEPSNHVRKPARLAQYAKLYHLMRLGENRGLWFYRSDAMAAGLDTSEPPEAICEIPKGKYALATILDPMSFSLNRVWNHMCGVLEDCKIKVRGIQLGNETAACLVSFSRQGTSEVMQVWIPID